MAGTTQHTRKTIQETYATLDDLQSLRREIHEDVSRFRNDVLASLRELDGKLAKRTDTNWTTVLTAISIALILAGMAAALINSTLNAESTQRRMAVTVLDAQNSRDQLRIDKLLDRELDDAFHRGGTEQKFATIQSDLESAIQNRKDIDAKHVAAQQAIDEKITELSHELNNGLGRRIEEILSPVIERVIGLERQVFKDTSP